MPNKGTGTKDFRGGTIMKMTEFHKHLGHERTGTMGLLHTVSRKSSAVRNLKVALKATWSEWSTGPNG